MNLTLFDVSKLSRLPNEYRVLGADIAKLREILAKAGTDEMKAETIVSLPTPDHRFLHFRIYESPIMARELANTLPETKTYAGYCVEEPGNSARLAVTPEGITASVITATRMFHVEPLMPRSATYLSFFRPTTAVTGAFRCLTTGRELPRKVPDTRSKLRSFTTPFGGQRRTYRLALATAAEYTNHFRQSGDSDEQTKNRVLNAIVATISVVNLVYEHEFTVTLVLVAQERNIIFTDAATDPYSFLKLSDGRLDTKTLFDQNQATLNKQDVVGVANYDIGHLFGLENGSAAILQGVCDNERKARAYTGRPNPQGPAFDFNYVAHEIGHQFGATHTHFGCINQQFEDPDSNVLGTTYEPGSGSTIMAYSADPPICDDNIQPVSDPYFHASSLDQVTDYIRDTSPSWGGACPITTSSGNHPPTIGDLADAVIPPNTAKWPLLRYCRYVHKNINW